MSEKKRNRNKTGTSTPKPSLNRRETKRLQQELTEKKTNQMDEEINVNKQNDQEMSDKTEDVVMKDDEVATRLELKFKAVNTTRTLRAGRNSV
jgi:hypothetical protein